MCTLLTFCLALSCSIHRTRCLMLKCTATIAKLTSSISPWLCSSVTSYNVSMLRFTCELNHPCSETRSSVYKSTFYKVEWCKADAVAQSRESHRFYH